jgi:hypothetical protein
MANLPSRHPDLGLHLTDRAATPLITSTRSEAQFQSISSLSQTALLAHGAALRLGLGVPRRIMVECSQSGPVLLHSFINPPSTRSTAASNSANGNPLPRSEDDHEGEQHGRSSRSTTAPPPDDSAAVESVASVAPLLLSTVVAPSADSVLEARRAAARLERVGRQVQARWAEAQRHDEAAGATT